MSDPRRHHKVPESYLAGFTSDGTRAGQLCVINANRLSMHTVRPKNAAIERDYYRLDEGAEDEFAAEKALSSIEAQGIAQIRLIADGSGLDQVDLATLIDFMAVQRVRVDAARNPMKDFLSKITDAMMSMSLSTEDTWKAVVASTEASGVSLPAKDYESMKAYYEQARPTVEFNNGFYVSMQFSMAERLSVVLRERAWTLIRNLRANTHPFVTHDNPVCLIATKEFPPMLPPGFLSREAFVVFPLSVECSWLEVCLMTQFPQCLRGVRLQILALLPDGIHN